MSSEIPDISADSPNDQSLSNIEPIEEAVEVPNDIYERIVQQVQQICETVNTPAHSQIHESFRDVDSQPEVPASPVEFETSRPTPPATPGSLAETGLSLNQISDLILKIVYLNGTLTGFEISRELRLPFSVIDEGLSHLKAERSLEVSSGDLAGRLSYRFSLTEQGRNRSREAFDNCRYVGPAPVSLSDYFKQCLAQATRNVPLSREDLKLAFQDIVMEESLFSRLGPAILSGQSIFLFGTPGNGKTMVAKAIGAVMDRCGGEIYVPYAVSVDRHIITVFDPSLHHSSSDESETSDTARHTESGILEENDIDQRWRRIRRPVIMTGGELSLDMLDLKFHAGSGFYTAPLHMKSNGGVFLLDDFGRQLVPASELLNRWILPLEERIDYLTLSTGKKFSIPFEQLIVFSTNLNPDDLADDAFLRRIRHKIPIPPPSESQFRSIFRKCCEQKKIRYDDWIVTQLLNNHYNSQRPLKSSDPRDLLDIVQSICRFKEQKFHLSEEVLTEAWRECQGVKTGSVVGEEV